MPKRLIDANALIDLIPSIDGETTMQCVERAITNAPTVDAVSVVRCCECIHRDPEDKRCDADMGIGRGVFRVNDNDFCSYGERKVSE